MYRLNHLKTCNTVATIFDFLRHCRAGFPNRHQFTLSGAWVPVLAHSRRYFSLPVFSIPAVLAGVKWCIVLVLMCVSPVTPNAEHLTTWSLSLPLFPLYTCAPRAILLASASSVLPPRTRPFCCSASPPVRTRGETEFLRHVLGFITAPPPSRGLGRVRRWFRLRPEEYFAYLVHS